MKKVLSLILSLVLCLSLCACGGNDHDTTNMKNNNSDYGEQTDAPDEASDSQNSMTQYEIEQEVEKAALDGVCYYLDESKYDVDATKYKIGSIRKYEEYKYEVNGTLYLYNKYGSLEDVAYFTCDSVWWVEEEGYAINMGSVDIDY